MRAISFSLLGVLVAMTGVACESTVGGAPVGATPSSSSATTGVGGAGAAPSVGGTSSDGGGGAGGSAAQGGGMGGSSTCDDMGPGESNNTEVDATMLSGSDDCDEDPGKTVMGTIDGPTDVDWYFYDQTDDVQVSCKTDPGRTWSQSAGGNMRVCKYVECQEGDPPDFDCPEGTTEDTSPAARPGCCGTEPFEIGGLLGLNCSGFEDVVTVYLKIDEQGAAADNCNQYNLNYHF